MATYIVGDRLVVNTDLGRDYIPLVKHRDYQDDVWRTSLMYSRTEVARMLAFYRRGPRGTVKRVNVGN